MLQVSIIHYSLCFSRWWWLDACGGNVSLWLQGCTALFDTNRGDLGGCLHLQVRKSLYGVRDAKRLPPTTMRQVAMFLQESPLSIQGPRPRHLHRAMEGFYLCKSLLFWSMYKSCNGVPVDFSGNLPNSIMAEPDQDTCAVMLFACSFFSLNALLFFSLSAQGCSLKLFAFSFVRVRC
jgi:hypothetical protein